MNIEELDYQLDKKLIAQNPLRERSKSRLLVVSRKHGKISDHHFYDLEYFLGENDVLVLNDSRVIPARLFGRKEGGEAYIEVLLLRSQTNKTWKVLIKNQKRLKTGSEIVFEAHSGKFEGLKATLLEKEDNGTAILRFHGYEDDFLSTLLRYGHSPLPPYIKEQKGGITERYQTVYAKDPGSSAAPTAGLHFNKDLLNKLLAKKVIIEYVTLHVGLGTFQPIKEEKVEDHNIHKEWYSLNKKTADNLNHAKTAGKRIIAVGTTAVRTLETCTDDSGTIKAANGETDLFIMPGYKWKFVDSMITNFHLPKTTLLSLVMSFAGKELILDAYKHAISEKYRFFSYGDSMWIK